MRVEFYGVPRQRAGIAELSIEAATLGELLEQLSAGYPAFRTLVNGNRLHPSIAASLNGDRFVQDPATRINANDCVLIISADVGG